MLGWLRRTLRKWLLEDVEVKKPQQAKFSPLLQCVFGGRVITCHITGRVGMCLQGRPLGEEKGDWSSRIITQRDALDSEEFNAMWRHFVGDSVLEWEEP